MPIRLSIMLVANIHLSGREYRLHTRSEEIEHGRTERNVPLA